MPFMPLACTMSNLLAHFVSCDNNNHHNTEGDHDVPFSRASQTHTALLVRSGQPLPPALPRVTLSEKVKRHCGAFYLQEVCLKCDSCQMRCCCDVVTAAPCREWLTREKSPLTAQRFLNRTNVTAQHTEKLMAAVVRYVLKHAVILDATTTEQVKMLTASLPSPLLGKKRHKNHTTAERKAPCEGTNECMYAR